jgi:putative endonuclease
VSFTYLLASQRNGTLYAGNTDDLSKRVQEHRTKALGGFTAKYGVDKLVWFETHPTREQAFRRERQIKEWRRAWKLILIERTNPGWKDLFDDLEQLLAEAEERELSKGLTGPNLSDLRRR